MKFYKFCTSFLSGILRLVFKVEIISPENEPIDGAVLVCANHVSLWDPVILAVCLKRPMHYMAKVELFKIPVLSFLIKALGAFPVTRGGVDIASIRTAIGYLKNGENVGMFPQGKRCRGVELSETQVKSGVGMVVMRAEAPMLPVAIVTEGNKIKMFKKIKIVVGTPISYAEFDGMGKSRAEFQQISDRVFAEICALEEKERISGKKAAAQ